MKDIRAVLNATDQYIFISSARVYVESNNSLDEDDTRLLNVRGGRKEYGVPSARHRSP